MDESIKRYTKQYPIGPSRNIDIKVEPNKVSLKWTDPDNPILDKIYFSKWEFTKVIRKATTPPTNIFDGELLLDCKEHNKYKDIYFEDATVEPDKTYYYAIVPCSDLGKHYWEDRVDIIEITPVNFHKTLDNNSWGNVKIMAKNGCADKVWSIGDTKVVTLGEPFNKNITLRISNFINDMDNIPKEEVQRQYIVMDSTELLIVSDIANIQNALPNELKNILFSEVHNIDEYRLLNDPVYTDNNSRIKYVDKVATAYNAGTKIHIDNTGNILEGNITSDKFCISFII